MTFNQWMAVQKKNQSVNIWKFGENEENSLLFMFAEKYFTFSEFCLTLRSSDHWRHLSLREAFSQKMTTSRSNSLIVWGVIGWSCINKDVLFLMQSPNFAPNFVTNAKLHYSEVSNKRTVYAYLISEKIPPCTLLLETCTLINFWLWVP